MSDYYIANPTIGAPGPVTATHTSPQYPIGLKVVAVDRAQATSGGFAAGEFLYARGSNVASGGQFAMLVNGSAVLLNSASSLLKWQIGVAPAALSATNVYGWVQVQGLVDYGRAPASNLSLPTIGTGVYLCATDGAVHTASAAGSMIAGVNIPVSCASGSVTTGTLSGTANSERFKYYLNGACQVLGVAASI